MADLYWKLSEEDYLAIADRMNNEGFGFVNFDIECGNETINISGYWSGSCTQDNHYYNGTGYWDTSIHEINIDCTTYDEEGDEISNDFSTDTLLEYLED